MQPFPAMQKGLELGTVWGIPIRIHPSWFLVFALVAWSLAAGYFPLLHPGWPLLAYWIVGAVASALLFASILVHELGHAWVARRNGVPTRGITLFVFGGVAQIAREPASPGVELRIATAGPATSLLLALAFAGLWLLVRPLEMAAAPALWLARINTMVAVFNLFPGFPLDGGRILRAAVWRRTGSLRQASRAAAATGRVVALGLIGLGMLVVLSGNVIGGLWTALIGWFLQNASATTTAEAELRELLRGAPVIRAMTTDCATVAGKVTLDRLVQEQVLASGRRCFLVTDGVDRLQGLLTLHELKTVPRERWGETAAEEVMVPVGKLSLVGPADSLLSALEKMDDSNVAQLPVVEGERLLGLIGREQILRYFRTRAELGV